MSEGHWPDWLRSGRMGTTDLPMDDTTRERNAADGVSLLLPRLDVYGAVVIELQ